MADDEHFCASKTGSVQESPFLMQTALCSAKMASYLIFQRRRQGQQHDVPAVVVLPLLSPQQLWFLLQHWIEGSLLLRFSSLITTFFSTVLPASLFSGYSRTFAVFPSFLYPYLSLSSLFHFFSLFYMMREADCALHGAATGACMEHTAEDQRHDHKAQQQQAKQVCQQRQEKPHLQKYWYEICHKHQQLVREELVLPIDAAPSQQQQGSHRDHHQQQQNEVLKQKHKSQKKSQQLLLYRYTRNEAIHYLQQKQQQQHQIENGICKQQQQIQRQLMEQHHGLPEVEPQQLYSERRHHQINCLSNGKEKKQQESALHKDGAQQRQQKANLWSPTYDPTTTTAAATAFTCGSAAGPCVVSALLLSSMLVSFAVQLIPEAVCASFPPTIDIMKEAHSSHEPPSVAAASPISAAPDSKQITTAAAAAVAGHTPAESFLASPFSVEYLLHIFDNSSSHYGTEDTSSALGSKQRKRDVSFRNASVFPSKPSARDNNTSDSEIVDQHSFGAVRRLGNLMRISAAPDATALTPLTMLHAAVLSPYSPVFLIPDIAEKDQDFLSSFRNKVAEVHQQQQQGTSDKQRRNYAGAWDECSPFSASPESAYSIGISTRNTDKNERAAGHWGAGQEDLSEAVRPPTAATPGGSSWRDREKAVNIMRPTDDEYREKQHHLIRLPVPRGTEQGQGKMYKSTELQQQRGPPSLEGEMQQQQLASNSRFSGDNTTGSSISAGESYGSATSNRSTSNNTADTNRSIFRSYESKSSNNSSETSTNNTHSSLLDEDERTMRSGSAAASGVSPIQSHQLQMLGIPRATTADASAAERSAVAATTAEAILAAAAAAASDALAAAVASAARSDPFSGEESAISTINELNAAIENGFMDGRSSVATTPHVLADIVSAGLPLLSSSARQRPRGRGRRSSNSIAFQGGGNFLSLDEEEREEQQQQPLVWHQRPFVALAASAAQLALAAAAAQLRREEPHSGSSTRTTSDSDNGLLSSFDSSDPLESDFIPSSDSSESSTSASSNTTSSNSLGNGTDLPGESSTNVSTVVETRGKSTTAETNDVNTGKKDVYSAEDQKEQDLVFKWPDDMLVIPVTIDPFNAEDQEENAARSSEKNKAEEENKSALSPPAAAALGLFNTALEGILHHVTGFLLGQSPERRPVSSNGEGSNTSQTNSSSKSGEDSNERISDSTAAADNSTTPSKYKGDIDTSETADNDTITTSNRSENGRSSSGGNSTMRISSNSRTTNFIEEQEPSSSVLL